MSRSIKPTTEIPTPPDVTQSTELHDNVSEDLRRTGHCNNPQPIPCTIPEDQEIRLTQNGMTLNDYIYKATMYHDNIWDCHRRSAFFTAFIAGLDDGNLKSIFLSKLREKGLTRTADDSVSLIYDLNWETFREELKSVQQAIVTPGRSSSIFSKAVEGSQRKAAETDQVSASTTDVRRKARAPWHPGMLKYGV